MPRALRILIAYKSHVIFRKFGENLYDCLAAPNNDLVTVRYGLSSDKVFSILLNPDLMPVWNSCWQISTTFCTYALQVAWIKADTKAILAIHEHVITNNARLSVTHNDVNTWTLNLRGVKREDRGQYMCQVNTDPMKSQVSVWSAPVQSMFLTLVME